MYMFKVLMNVNNNSLYKKSIKIASTLLKGPSTLATLFSHRWPRFCGGDIYSRRKPIFSSFGEHTAVCGSSPPQTERFCGCVLRSAASTLAIVRVTCGSHSVGYETLLSTETLLAGRKLCCRRHMSP